MENERSAVTAVATEKEALELSKLRLEAEKLRIETSKLSRERRLAPWTLVAQVFGSLCILAATGLVLYFFQSPQLGQMEATRISTERYNIENLVLAVQKLDSDSDKLAAYEHLVNQWPNYAFLKDLARSQTAIIAAKKTASDCSANAAQIDSLNASIKSLEERMNEGISIGGSKVSNPNRPALEAQSGLLQVQLRATRAMRRVKKCPDL